MKKKLTVFAGLFLALMLLTACGSHTESASAPAATPTATADVFLQTTPIPAPGATPFTVPTAPTTAAPTMPPAPTITAPPAVTPAPAMSAPPVMTMMNQSNLPRITKNPTDETVIANGECQFVTRYENAELAEWHFVSPNGALDANYRDVQTQFPGLRIIGGNTKDLTLQQIPEAFNGVRVYCRFSNRAGSVDTASALITVLPAPKPSQRFEGRWAEETAGRCRITLSTRPDGNMNVDISWSGSAWQNARWQMTARPYRDDMMVYDDGHAWVENYSDNTNYTVTDETFGGTGSFYIINGKLYWYNDQTGEETVLIRA